MPEHADVNTAHTIRTRMSKHFIEVSPAANWFVALLPTTTLGHTSCPNLTVLPAPRTAGLTRCSRGQARRGDRKACFPRLYCG